ncbi:transcriptional regulator [Desulfallas thermosapovorans]|uniref:Repressor LexA n=1 Tax=Desulfallas thermosapovorans DSM 6562 TaxID=1121431 RepID=A0A5S4ZNB9_9FIRM|nr:transcriptional regulator [Desulfallas thermosapovorans]TYO92803.1 repressor LexA [Desulfallas thermosapovorans DSM 6562]
MVDDARIIDAIEELSGKGYPPTFRELMQEVGLRSPSTIKCRLEKLRRAGRVDWQPQQPRTLRVVRRV